MTLMGVRGRPEKPLFKKLRRRLVRKRGGKKTTTEGWVLLGESGFRLEKSTKKKKGERKKN